MNLPRHFQVRVGFPLTITVKVTVILAPQRVVQYDCLCLLRCLGLELDTPYQWPQMLPLRYADIPSYILSASLFCTNANFELELMYCKVKDVSSYPPQTYTQHTTLTLHTPLSLICISSPLISYHINLTLYMGQC